MHDSFVFRENICQSVELYGLLFNTTSLLHILDKVTEVKCDKNIVII